MAKVFIWARQCSLDDVMALRLRSYEEEQQKFPGCRGTILDQMKKNYFSKKVSLVAMKKIMFGAAGFDLNVNGKVSFLFST